MTKLRSKMQGTVDQIEVENPVQEKEWWAGKGDERLVVDRNRRSELAKAVGFSLSMIGSWY